MKPLTELTIALAAACFVWMADARTCRVILIGLILGVALWRHIARPFMAGSRKP